MHTLRLTNDLRGPSSRASNIIARVGISLALLASVAGLAGGFAVPVSAQQSATMALSGPTAVAVDGTFTVEIRVKTTKAVNAVQADISYPTSVLQYQSVSNAGTAFNADLISNAANGNVSLVRAKIGGGSGDMLVSTLTFRAIKDGRAEIRLADTSMATDAETSENIVSIRQGMTIVIGNASPDAPVETGADPVYGVPGGGPPAGGTDDPQAAPTIDPDLDNEVPLGNGNGSTKNDRTSNGDDATMASISPVAWTLMGMSLLLIAVSVFFSVNILRRRNRRLATYQSYMQPPVSPMYNQGQFYNMNSAGYTSRPYQQNPYQQPQQALQPQAGGYQQQLAPQQPQQPAYQQQYPQYQSQYPARQAYPQAPGQAPVNQSYQQPNPSQQNNQYHW